MFTTAWMIRHSSVPRERKRCPCRDGGGEIDRGENGGSDRRINIKEGLPRTPERENNPGHHQISRNLFFYAGPFTIVIGRIPRRLSGLAE